MGIRALVRLVVLAVPPLALLPGAAAAQDLVTNMFWRNIEGNRNLDVGGFWQDSPNWSELQGHTLPATGLCPDPIFNCDPIETNLPASDHRAVFDIGGTYTLQFRGNAASTGIDFISGNVTLLLDDLGLPVTLNAGPLLAVKPGDPQRQGYASAQASFSGGSLVSHHFMAGLLFGTDSTLNFYGVDALSDGLSIGQAGNGTLNLGSVSSDGGPPRGTYLRTTQQNGLNAAIGGQGGSHGVVNVSNGATWEILSGPVTVGGQPGSNAELNIIGTRALDTAVTSGLVLGHSSMDLARSTDSFATVNVLGANARLAMPGGITIGAGGNGTMNVLEGGEVTSDATSTSGIGTFTSSNGQVTVSGTGPLIAGGGVGRPSTWTLGSLTIGGGGNGTLTVGSGGVVNAAGNVFVQRQGLLDVNAGGTLSSGSITVQFGGRGSLAGSVRTASVTVDGNGSSVLQTGDGVLISDGAGAGSLSITNGGVYTGAPKVGYSSDKTGVANIQVNGIGSQWQIGSSYALGAGGGLANASVMQSGFVSSNDLTVGGASQGNLFITQNSEWTVHGAVNVGGTPGAGSGDPGHIELQNGGRLSVSNGMKVWSAGSVRVSGGQLTLSGPLDVAGGRVELQYGSVDASGPLSVTNGGMYKSSDSVVVGSGGFSSATVDGGTIDADIELRGGTLASSAPFVVGDQHSLYGNGTIAATGGTFLEGTLAPGFDEGLPAERFGVLRFEGDLTFAAGSRSIFEIAGIAPGELDQVAVKGTALFGGTLELVFLDGYAPQAGDVIPLFVDDFLGAFDQVSIFGLAPGFQYSLFSSPTGLSLLALNDGIAAAVPEPQTYALLLLGLAILLVRRIGFLRLALARAAVLLLVAASLSPEALAQSIFVPGPFPGICCDSPYDVGTASFGSIDIGMYSAGVVNVAGTLSVNGFNAPFPYIRIYGSSALNVGPGGAVQVFGDSAQVQAQGPAAEINLGAGSSLAVSGANANLRVGDQPGGLTASLFADGAQLQVDGVGVLVGYFGGTGTMVLTGSTLGVGQNAPGRDPAGVTIGGGDGSPSTGTLVLQGASFAQIAAPLWIGADGSTGAVNVSGSSLYASDIRLGVNNGNAQLHADGGSLVHSDHDLQIGGAGGGSAAVEVSGAGTTLVSNGLSIGTVNGSASLGVTNGAAATAGYAIVATSDGASGSFTVHGPGSIANLAQLEVGTLAGSASGTVEASYGGVINVGDVYVRTGGALNVLFPGMTADDVAPDPLSPMPRATLNARSITLSGGGSATFTGDVNVGSSITVAGAGSRISQGADSTVLIGTSGVGSLNVVNGGVYDFGGSQLTIGLGASGLGLVNVQGSGSAWRAPGASLTVGNADSGFGQVTVSDNGFVSTGSLTVGGRGQGAVDMDSGSSWVVNGNVSISPLVTVTTVYLCGEFLQRTCEDVARYQQEGRVSIRNSASMSIGGTLSVQSPGHVELQGGTLSAASVQTSGDVSGFGRINGNVTVAEHGFFTASGGPLDVHGSVTSLPGSFVGPDYSPLTATRLDVSGDLFGTGTVSTAEGVFVHGRLGAGFPDAFVDADHSRIGTLEFLGALTLGSDATTVFDIAGAQAGDYDQIIVKGTALFGGALDLVFLDGFAPHAGDVFSLFADDFLGAFDQVSIFGLAPGFQYSLFSSPSGLSLLALNDGIAAAVPEPQTYALLLLGLAVLLLERKPKRPRPDASMA